ncbi:DMT family transporter [Mangrovitalea sediminis]|uniref:DMT family transporter n=1 Tax=Mangrovitalea sediminis TaxID=1982043 RepID=UPI000BE4B424|nr:DMT family transporter [Mangrovitalea sediminis]
MERQRKAVMLGLLTVLLWSTVASAFKLSLAAMTPVQLLFYASLVSIFVLGSVLALQGRFSELWRYSRRQYLQSLGLGLMNPCLYYLVLFGAYNRLPAQEAQPLNYTWALTLTYLSVPLLKQRLRPLDVVAGLVCYLGVVVIASRGDLLSLHFADTMGVVLALSSTLIWALYWIANTRDRRDPVAGLLLNFLFGLPFIALICAFTDGFEVERASGLIGAAYVGVFEMGISYVLWLNAMKLADNTATISNFIFISPFLSLIFIHYLVGEKILPATYVGLVLIVAGLVLQRVKRKVLRRRVTPE